MERPGAEAGRCGGGEEDDEEVDDRRGGEHGTGWGRRWGVPGGGSTGVVGFFLARFERGPTPERLGCDVRAPRYGRAQ